jgi:hypothetical protein
MPVIDKATFEELKQMSGADSINNSSTCLMTSLMIPDGAALQLGMWSPFEGMYIL